MLISCQVVMIFATLRDCKENVRQMWGGGDDQIGSLAVQLRFLAEPAQHAHRLGACRFPRPDIEGGIADHQTGAWRHIHTLRGPQYWVGVGLGVTAGARGGHALEKGTQSELIQECKRAALAAGAYHRQGILLGKPREHLDDPGDEQEARMVVPLAKAEQGVPQDCQLIIDSQSIRQAEQDIPGAFDRHDDPPGNRLEVMAGKQGLKGLQPTSQALDILVIGVAQGAIDIEAQGADPGKIKGHGGREL